MAIPGTPSKIFISSVQRELASERRSVKSFWRDWLTDEVLAGYHLSDRQMGAIAYLKTHRSITNYEFHLSIGVHSFEANSIQRSG